MELVKTDFEDQTPSVITYGPKLSPFRHIRSMAQQLVVVLFVAALTFGFYLLCRGLIVQAVQVSGASMAPTLLDSQRYLLNRMVYSFREPRREDIVVLRDPAGEGYAVKRIVALPGDSIYVKDGHLFVNGVLAHESYLKPDTQTYAGPDYASQFWICGVNQYFVLGDNRNNSADSRNYGVVARESILGRVVR